MSVLLCLPAVKGCLTVTKRGQMGTIPVSMTCTPAMVRLHGKFLTLAPCIASHCINLSSRFRLSIDLALDKKRDLS
jgi:hypothetical protein